MAEVTDKFYNLKIDLLSRGNICSETAAIRSVIEKENTVFFDIYIYRLKKAFMFEKNFIRIIYDLSRDRVYNDIDRFIADFKKEVAATTSISKTIAPTSQNQKSAEILKPLFADIVLLLFMAHMDIDNKNLKEKVVFEYIQANLPQGENLSFPYVQKYFAELKPQREDFYQALTLMRERTQEEVEIFYKALLKICLSDGRMHYTERLYLAEIIQFFRLHNIKLV